LKERRLVLAAGSGGVNAGKLFSKQMAIYKRKQKNAAVCRVFLFA
jgi:hypothetical protein